MVAPDGVAGQRRRDLVQSGDFALTALDYAGIETEADDYESVSQRALLVDPAGTADPDRPLFVSPSLGWKGVRWGRYKWLSRHNVWFPARVLFDLEADPGETVDLAEDPRYADVVEHFERLLDQELDRPAPLVSPGGTD